MPEPEEKDPNASADPEGQTKGQQKQNAVDKAAAKRKADKEELAKLKEEELKEAGDKSFRVKCTAKVIGVLYDPNRNITIPSHVSSGDIVAGGPLKKGSWLDVQIKSGLVRIVK